MKIVALEDRGISEWAGAGGGAGFRGTGLRLTLRGSGLVWRLLGFVRFYC